MSELRKILTVQEEREVEDIYYKIYSWYIEQLKQHEKQLPVVEFDIAKIALVRFLKRAREFRNTNDLVGIKAWYGQTVWFVLPWQVTLWYAIMKKDKGKEEVCQTNRTIRIKK